MLCFIHRPVNVVGKHILVNVYYGYVHVGSYTLYTVHTGMIIMESSEVPQQVNLVKIEDVMFDCLT